jgi:ribosomal protein S18 acetylase RimI-like enzyme
MHTIQNTTPDDLPFVYRLFDDSIVYQQTKGFPVWNNYDKAALAAEVANHQQFKVMRENTILCIFSICLTDPVIWREREQGDALYLHRIVVNKEYKGQKQFEKILTWAVQYAKANNLKYIRIDTWGNNQTIINYYQSFGFEFVENFTTPSTEALPVQHRNLYLALLEYRL